MSINSKARRYDRIDLSSLKIEVSNAAGGASLLNVLQECRLNPYFILLDFNIEVYSFLPLQITLLLYTSLSQSLDSKMSLLVSNI